MVEISGATKTTSTLDESGYIFVPIEADAKVFPTLFNKENIALFEKWGIQDTNLIIEKYRFNQSFNPL